MMYISSFRYSDAPEQKYDIDMELLDEEWPGNPKVVGQARGITEPELIREIGAFFGSRALNAYSGFGS